MHLAVQLAPARAHARARPQPHLTFPTHTHPSHARTPRPPSALQYLSYDSPTTTNANAEALAASATGGRRRLARGLLQVEASGADLKILINTNAVRVDSEIQTLLDGVDSGALADDLTLAGVATDNLTVLLYPYTQDLVDTTASTSSSSSGGVHVRRAWGGGGDGRGGRGRAGDRTRRAAGARA